jgi:hypothetical protein
MATPSRSNRRSLRILAIAVLGFGLRGNAPAQTRKLSDLVRLDPKRCVAIETEKRQWLTPEWQRFLDFVNVCPVRQDSARPQLFIVTIRVLDFDATLPENAPAPKYPLPLIVLPDGTRVGSLPYPFPDDPPRTLRVSFRNWRDGFPSEIMLYLDDPTVTGSRSMPALKWNAARKQYSSSPPTREK